MRNKYPGKCYRCHNPVAPGDGHFERYHGGWRVQHASCAVIGREVKNERQRQLKLEI